MGTDLRGFIYLLEPVRRKQQWQLDALQSKLGRAQRALDDALAILRRLEDRHAEAIELLGRAIAGRVDPSQHQRGFAYMAQLQQQIAVQNESVERRQVLRDDARTACFAQQQKVDLTAQHRDLCLNGYRIEEQTRQSAEADRDWIARSLWIGAAIPNNPVHGPDEEKEGL